MSVRIGISGWTYKPWRGTFYPEDLAQKKELEFASRQLSSIEINGTFYALQKPSIYQSWYRQTPDDFVFSVKANRYISHLKRLKDIELPLMRFFESGPLELKEKLGPFLWQFPPSMKFDPERFELFFKLLPRTFKEAGGYGNKRIRHAVEVRHPSFCDEAFFNLAEKFNVAIVIADTAGKWPYIERITSDFMYLRLHGDEELYVSGYDDESLDDWAKKIRRWKKKGLDVFVYFDNDAKVRAPVDAKALRKRIERSIDR